MYLAFHPQNLSDLIMYLYYCLKKDIDKKIKPLSYIEKSIVK